MRRVVGRDRELAAVDRLLEHGLEGFSAALLVGDAGIGKTTVLQEAVRLGEEAGFQVLRCRPAQAEAKLGLASLADLLERVGEGVLAGLPEPQRLALDAVLLRSSDGPEASASRAVAAGWLSVLRRLAEQGPVLVAIDDVQWLDRASASALAFALRRLGPADRVALVATLRLDGSAHADPLGFAQLPPGTSERLGVGPLTLSALYHVIQEQLGLVLPRPTLQRVAEASAGNPLLAIELARALTEADERPGPGEPLPVPAEIVGLFAARLTRLPESTREPLLAAALLSDPTSALLQSVIDAPVEAHLERARQAQLIEVRGDRIRFAHPLVGAALASSVLPARRRAMHRRLAEVVASPEEQARHLALGSAGPDEDVAARLDEAARLAVRRGAPEDAADLLELAARLTPADNPEGAARRRVELARALQRAGDLEQAAALLDDLLGGATTEGPLRAQALELRAHLLWVAGTSGDAEASCEEALTCLGEADGELRARVLVTLARVTIDAERCRLRSLAALDALEQLDRADPGLVAEALVGLAGSEYYLGNGIPMDVVERALELEQIAPSANVGDRMSAALGSWLKYDGDLAGARRWLEATRQAALDEGDEASLPYALSHLPQLELWSGDWQLAEARALEHLELAASTGQRGERMTAIFNLALVHAHMGRVDETRARIDQALREAESVDPWHVYQLLSVRGFLELSAGAAADAVRSLAQAYEIYESTGHGDTPSVFENYPEALVSVGDLETAEQVIDVFEGRARKAGKAIALAPALRCRAALLASTGRLEEAVTALDDAMTQHERVDMPFARARTQLVRGQVSRRRGERRAARATLEQALATFDELGSPLWSEKARAELARVPSRRGSGDELTATEARVAELVALGKSNDEVAQELFVSKKTVEANLTRIYRKLGVRSRLALAARLSEPEGEGRAAKV